MPCLWYCAGETFTTAAERQAEAETEAKTKVSLRCAIDKMQPRCKSRILAMAAYLLNGKQGGILQLPMWPWHSSHSNMSLPNLGM